MIDAALRLVLGEVGNSMAAHRQALAGRGRLVRWFFPDMERADRGSHDGTWLAESEDGV